MAKPLKDVELINEQIQKCVRCGKCRTVCPIFREMRTENFAPRGQVYLTGMVRNGKIEPSKAVAKKFGNCLMCENCYSNCPSGIKVQDYVCYARAYMDKLHPNYFNRILFRRLWTNNGFLDFAHQGLKFYQYSGLRQFMQKSGLLSHLPADLGKVEGLLPTIPKKTAKQMLPEVSPARGEKKIRVGYFLGCGTNIFYPSIATSLVSVLNRNGVEVVIPHASKCCGRPSMANGQVDAIRGLANTNITAYADKDLSYIVTDCASCSTLLMDPEYYVKIFKDTPLEAKARDFTSKIIDINVFLVDVLKITTDGLAEIPKTRVTYHNSCHLRSQKITQQPRKILQMVPGVDYIEMSEAEKCCGSAGTFAVSHLKISQKILKRKIVSIKETEAQVVAACCPTCAMQIGNGAKIEEINLKTVHPIELLEKAYQAGEKTK